MMHFALPKSFGFARRGRFWGQLVWRFGQTKAFVGFGERSSPTGFGKGLAPCHRSLPARLDRVHTVHCYAPKIVPAL
jgi:hypothetical protein